MQLKKKGIIIMVTPSHANAGTDGMWRLGFYALSTLEVKVVGD